ncbi:hypothetical protein CHL78_018020 [Romboutsia weinsteinii]|uniref:Uncharacterized protein n=1 Tax=Romboutsia weinsteinii TaxID=2020949 RepID=A0A371IYC0_9FIRM|nr:hypothetical protein [Romboutsia weinsteinii]RDY25470.1 hypothetical protein CHL78_018020 [Romboutsia weinsteinii]
MLDLIKSISIEVSGYLAVMMLVLIIIVHGLVILKILPHTWINGGRSTSYESQRKQSMLGIIVLTLTILILLIASNIITVSIPSILSSIINTILWIMVILLAISTVMQLFGTYFEKYVMSIIAFILLVCVLRIAL